MNASVDSRASKLAALAARVVPVLRYTDASAAAYAAEVAWWPAAPRWNSPGPSRA